jgi:Uma2 family endonuclease
MIICNRDIIKGNGVYGTPDLVVEVLSRSTAKRDRGYKKDIYERCGVRELWLVDTVNRSVELYVNENERFALKNVCTMVPDGDPQYMSDEEKSKDGYEFSPIIFPDIIISLEEIFEDTDF